MSLSRIMVHYYYYIIKSYCLRRWQIRLPYGNSFATRCSASIEETQGFNMSHWSPLSGMNSTRIVATAAMVG